MRLQLCESLVERSGDANMLFLTGDLGFMALEPLQIAMGERFINAGVAEQNMMTVSAALARQRFEVWVYSIAPFAYARPFEQLRNDIAFHNLPVNIIGNGGGYGYGVMGPTHHAIEDYGVLLTLPNVAVFAPVFDEDVPAIIEAAGNAANPTYVRLGRGEYPSGYQPPAFAPWRQLVSGGGPVLIAVGPLAGSYIAACQAVPEAQRPNLWAVGRLPVEANPPPDSLLAQLANGDRYGFAEEHVAQGGAAAQFALFSATRGLRLPRLHAFNARAHIYDRYGSQPYLRKRSQLDPEFVLKALAP